MNIKLCPSMKCSDFRNLEQEIELLQSAGADISSGCDGWTICT